MANLKSINPATEEILETYDEMSNHEVESKIDHSVKSGQIWGRMKMEDRRSFFENLRKELLKHKSQISELMALEMGKPLRQGHQEVEKSALLCEYAYQNAVSFLKDELIETDAHRSFVTYQPLGCILGIMPWNFPLWQVVRFAVPALFAGNTVLLKHAPNVCGTSLLIEEIFKKASFPPHTFQSLLLTNESASLPIKHPSIRGISFTGSVRGGREVASLAGQYLKKLVLELGGSDPFIVFEDAQLEMASETACHSRLLNSGQSCISAKRFIVHERVSARFENLLRSSMSSKKVGDPLEMNTDVGPLARADLREHLHGQVRSSIEGGAKLVLGGEIPRMKGYFYPPTILANVTPGMSVFEEETFGPVAAIISAKSHDEAVVLANQTSYGLGASLFSSDIQMAEKIAVKSLNAGACFVNALVRSDPRLPFGGIQGSGYGRELGKFGFREFVNIKTIYIQSL